MFCCLRFLRTGKHFSRLAVKFISQASVLAPVYFLLLWWLKLNAKELILTLNEHFERKIYLRKPPNNMPRSCYANVTFDNCIVCWQIFYSTHCLDQEWATSLVDGSDLLKMFSRAKLKENVLRVGHTIFENFYFKM